MIVNVFLWSEADWEEGKGILINFLPTLSFLPSPVNCLTSMTTKKCVPSSFIIVFSFFFYLILIIIYYVYIRTMYFMCMKKDFVLNHYKPTIDTSFHVFELRLWNNDIYLINNIWKLAWYHAPPQRDGWKTSISFIPPSNKGC